jgi:NitT/TauT family transport system substrate-binding protein
MSLGVLALVFSPGKKCIADGDGQKPDPGLTSVRIGYTQLRISLPIFAAQELGIFKKYGIDAQLEAYPTGQPLGQALVEGKIDVGGYFGFPISWNGILRTGHQLYFAGTQLEDKDHRISYLLRRKLPDGQISDIHSIKDLKGKKVGILPTIVYKATLEALLKKNGVDPADVVIQQVDPPLEPQLLASGGIDALYTIDPAATAAIVSGAGELVNPDAIEVSQLFGKSVPFGSFYFSKEWADENKELTAKITGALDEAIIYINGHPKEANRFLEPYLPATLQSQIAHYPDALFVTSYDLKDKLLIDLAQKYLKIGIINQPIDLKSVIYHGKRISKKAENS